MTVAVCSNRMGNTKSGHKELLPQSTDPVSACIFLWRCNTLWRRQCDYDICWTLRLPPDSRQYHMSPVMRLKTMLGNTDSLLFRVCFNPTSPNYGTGRWWRQSTGWCWQVCWCSASRLLASPSHLFVLQSPSTYLYSSLKWPPLKIIITYIYVLL
jgi:hypothetical protein